MTEESLWKAIIDRTREGPVESWVGRIALLARAAGVELANVNWNEAPATVAWGVIDEAHMNNKMEGLRRAIS